MVDAGGATRSVPRNGGAGTVSISYELGPRSNATELINKAIRDNPYFRAYFANPASDIAPLETAQAEGAIPARYRGTAAAVPAAVPAVAPSQALTPAVRSLALRFAYVRSTGRAIDLSSGPLFGYERTF